MPFMSSSVRTGFVLLMMLAVSEFHSISTLVSLNSLLRNRSKCAQSFLVPSSALLAIPGSSVSAIIGKSFDVYPGNVKQMSEMPCTVWRSI